MQDRTLEPKRVQTVSVSGVPGSVSAAVVLFPEGAIQRAGVPPADPSTPNAEMKFSSAYQADLTLPLTASPPADRLTVIWTLPADTSAALTC